MSGLAKYSLMAGKRVTGSDRAESTETKRLSALGAKIISGHKAAAVNGADLLVYTSAVTEKNSEIKRAKRIGVPVIRRSVLLGEIMDGYRLKIAVAGSHGKTTATAMIAQIFIDAGADPTVFLGGESFLFGNFRSGYSDTVIVEACEYKKNFLDLRPNVAVILNIDDDHPDTYKDMEEQTEAFRRFSQNAVTYINADDKNAVKAYNACPVTLGIERGACYVAKRLIKGKKGYAFTVFAYGKRMGRIELPVIGRHNVYNALCAVAVCSERGVPFCVIKKSLENYRGVARRNESLGHIGEIPVVSDYAHHPTEILSAVEEYGKGTLTVFQPHTYSRTKALFGDFVKTLSRCEGAIIYRTYPAREKFDVKGDGKTLFKALEKQGKAKVFYADGKERLFSLLDEKKSGYKKIAFIGAGDIDALAREYVKSRSSAAEK